MKLAKDETIGLVIAAVVGVAALGTLAYRSTWSKPRPAVAAAGSGSGSAAPAPVGTQAQRDGFADRLHRAFAEDNIDAVAIAEGTELHVRWFACSKQMLKALLDKKDDSLTRRLRQTSGLSIENLRAAGFTKLACDNARGKVSTEAIKK